MWGCCGGSKLVCVLQLCVDLDLGLEHFFSCMDPLTHAPGFTRRNGGGFGANKAHKEGGGVGANEAHGWWGGVGTNEAHGASLALTRHKEGGFGANKGHGGGEGGWCKGVWC